MFGLPQKNCTRLGLSYPWHTIPKKQNRVPILTKCLSVSYTLSEDNLTPHCFARGQHLNTCRYSNSVPFLRIWHVMRCHCSHSAFSGWHRKKAAVKDPKWLMWRPILIESKLSSGSFLIELSLWNQNIPLLRHSLCATYPTHLALGWAAAAHSAWNSGLRTSSNDRLTSLTHALSIWLLYDNPMHRAVKDWWWCNIYMMDSPLGNWTSWHFKKELLFRCPKNKTKQKKDEVSPDVSLNCTALHCKPVVYSSHWNQQKMAFLNNKWPKWLNKELLIAVLKWLAS